MKQLLQKKRNSIIGSLHLHHGSSWVLIYFKIICTCSSLPPSFFAIKRAFDWVLYLLAFRNNLGKIFVNAKIQNACWVYDFTGENTNITKYVRLALNFQQRPLLFKRKTSHCKSHFKGRLAVIIVVVKLRCPKTQIV